jgi:hypothetical protein
MAQWVAWCVVTGAILLSSGSAMMVCGGYADRFSAILAAVGVAFLAAALMMVGSIHAIV